MDNKAWIRYCGNCHIRLDLSAVSYWECPGCEIGRCETCHDAHSCRGHKSEGVVCAWCQTLAPAEDVIDMDGDQICKLCSDSKPWEKGTWYEQKQAALQWGR